VQLLFLSRTVIFALPAFIPLTLPELLTVATLVLLDVYLSLYFLIDSASLTVGLNTFVLPHFKTLLLYENKTLLLWYYVTVCLYFSSVGVGAISFAGIQPPLGEAFWKLYLIEYLYYISAAKIIKIF